LRAIKKIMGPNIKRKMMKKKYSNIIELMIISFDKETSRSMCSFKKI